MGTTPTHICNIVNLNFTHRLRLLFHKERESYFTYAQFLGFIPNNIKHYKTALTHRSVQQGKESNERLEYLGDAILNSIIAEILYHTYPNANEGFLTDTRSKIVMRAHLNQVGEAMHLTDYIITEHKVHLQNTSLLGNTVEAIIGAVYLDKGYKFTKQFVKDRIIDKKLNEFVSQDKNYKSMLLEYTQKRQDSVEFSLRESGKDEDGNPWFTSDVIINGVVIAHATGATKKQSHQKASRKAFYKLTKSRQCREQVKEARAQLKKKRHNN